eukprot:5018458-Alexandrium_andersonii.AAC.2
MVSGAGAGGRRVARSRSHAPTCKSCWLPQTGPPANRRQACNSTQPMRSSSTSRFSASTTTR